MLLFFAAGFTYAQDEPQQAAAGKFDFKAQITWYTQRTYTDPWRYGYLIGEATLNDFMFGGSKRWGTG